MVDDHYRCDQNQQYAGDYHDNQTRLIISVTIRQMLKIILHVVLEPVYVHVYRLKGSDLGFYHTGVGEIPVDPQFVFFGFNTRAFIPLQLVRYHHHHFNVMSSYHSDPQTHKNLFRGSGNRVHFLL